MLGRGTTAAADDVHQTFGRKLVQQPRGHFGRFIEAGVAHRIGQAGIGVAGDEGIRRGLGEFLQIGPHEGGAQCAVQPYGQRLGVAHAGPECGHGLAGQHAPGGVGHGATNDDGQPLAGLLKHFIDGEQRRLGVEGVENGFHQNDVGAAAHQGAGLLGIGCAQGLEIDIARTGVVDIGADARGLGRGAQSARDETRLVRGAELVAGRARQPGRGFVHLVHQFGHAVIVLRHRGRTKRIGLDQIGARGQIALVNVADDLRLRQAEQFVIALHIARPIFEALAAILRFAEFEALDHGAHGAIEDDDALLEQSRQLGGAGVGLGGGWCGWAVCILAW